MSYRVNKETKNGDDAETTAYTAVASAGSNYLELQFMHSWRPVVHFES